MGLRVSDSSGERFFEPLSGSAKSAELRLENAKGGMPQVEIVASEGGVSIRWTYDPVLADGAVNHAELKLFGGQ